MIGAFRIEGHALVSADDRIADASGRMPPELRNDADWRNFQAALRAAAVVVLGRRSHELSPNAGRHNRLVLSSGASGIERRDDTWWWNQAAVTAPDALAMAAPDGGTAAVVGGRPVFDLFLRLGFDAFHLARMARLKLPAGVAIFSGVDNRHTADDVLASAGLRADPLRVLDTGAGVTLVTWRAGAA